MAEEQSVASILAAARGGDYTKAAQLVGQVLTWTDEIETKSGSNGDYIVVTALTEDGEEVKVSNGGQLAEQIKGLAAAGLLPIDLKVSSFKAGAGTGYSLEEVD